MSALSDALAAAQARALSQLGKTYVASPLDAAELDSEAERLYGLLEAIGCTDHVEQKQLLAAWNVLRATGGTVPAEAAPSQEHRAKDEPASDAQLAYIAKLVKDSGVPAPDLPLSKARASEVIETIKAGTYDPVKWAVPF